MKTIRFIIPMLAACVAFFASCGDNDEDYRDAWVGTYGGSCNYHHSSGSDYQFDTVYTNETLTVSKGEENILDIHYLDQDFTVNCSPEGTLTSATNNPHSEWDGANKGDSLFFNYSDASQGHYTSRQFIGKKK